jgi:hypothetical protein
VTLTAPPRPPLPPRADAEALIAEARQRARRRRRIYAAAVALLVLVVTSLIVVFGRPEPPPSSLPEPSALPVPPDQDEAVSIVAGSAQFHLGWVVVYGDGRVIQMRDQTLEVFERRLTAASLDLVRSGAIQPTALLTHWFELPAEAWADPGFTPYVPSRYAACPDGPGVRPGHPTDIVGRLPAAARPLLYGKELRTYRNDLFSKPELFPPDPADRAHRLDSVECFEVSTEEAIVLFETLGRAGFAFGWLPGVEDVTRPVQPPPWAGAVRGPCGGVEQPVEIEVCFKPLLPHGGWFDMPG